MAVFLGSHYLSWLGVSRRDQAASSGSSQPAHVLVPTQQPPSPPAFPERTAAAQPTPGRTVTAAVGQFRAHAPHSMQPSPSTIRDFPSSMANTACGQTTAHIPQPSHLAASSVRVTTPGKYRSPNMVLPLRTADTAALRKPSHQPKHCTQGRTGRLKRRRDPDLQTHARQRCKGTGPREVHGQETRHRRNQ